MMKIFRIIINLHVFLIFVITVSMVFFLINVSDIYTECQVKQRISVVFWRRLESEHQVCSPHSDEFHRCYFSHHVMPPSSRNGNYGHCF
jgi:hypothetical protein